jgi:hypothetical protein
MVIVPLLVMKLNWACTTAGTAKNSRSSSNFLAQVILTMETFGFMLLPFQVVCLLLEGR